MRIPLASVRRFQDVEIRSLGSCVVKIQQQRGANLLLNVEIANLHVAQPVIRIHRITIGDAAGGWKPALQRQRWRIRGGSGSTLVAAVENGG